MFTYIQEIIKKGGILVDDQLLDLEITNFNLHICPDWKKTF